MTNFDETDYEQLSERVYQLARWLDAAYARLRELAVGSTQGTSLAQAVARAEREHNRLHRLARQHPDATPIG